MEKEKDPYEALLLMAQCKYFYHNVARDQDCLEYFDAIFYDNFESISPFFKKLDLFCIFDRNYKVVDIEQYTNLNIHNFKCLLYGEYSIVAIYIQGDHLVGFISLFLRCSLKKCFSSFKY